MTLSMNGMNGSQHLKHSGSSAIMLSVAINFSEFSMLSVTLLIVTMLSVTMLSVTMLSVVVPYSQHFFFVLS